jgi:hypothetical protein
MKKQRGRSNNPQPGPIYQAGRKDRKIGDEDRGYGAGNCAGAEDDRGENGPNSGYQAKSLSRHAGFPVSGSYLAAKDTAHGSGRQEHTSSKYPEGMQVDKSLQRAGHNGA